MKLNKTRIRWLINHKKKGESSEAVAKDMKLSRRRVEQIWREYRETGKEPVVGKNLGRPEKPITKDEAVIIKQAFDRYKFGARMLEPFLEGFYNIYVLHNRLHTHRLSGENCNQKPSLASAIDCLDCENMEKNTDVKL